MSGNGFREDELVSRRMKVGNEWQTRIFPVVGGRLRIIHETSSRLSIATEILKLEPDFAVVRATMESEKGKFCGTGTASTQRDARLADSLVELAETRSIARALRFGGIGVEFTSAEEVSHVATVEAAIDQTTSKGRVAPFSEGNGNGNGETKTQGGAHYGDRSRASSDALDPSTAGNGRSKPQSCGIEKPRANGAATTAQVRALYALTKRANYTAQDVESLLRPLDVSAFQELSREDASRLITYLQTEAA